MNIDLKTSPLLFNELSQEQLNDIIWEYYPYCLDLMCKNLLNEQESLNMSYILKNGNLKNLYLLTCEFIESNESPIVNYALFNIIGFIKSTVELFQRKSQLFYLLDNPSIIKFIESLNEFLCEIFSIYGVLFQEDSIYHLIMNEMKSIRNLMMRIISNLTIKSHKKDEIHKELKFAESFYFCLIRVLSSNEFSIIPLSSIMVCTKRFEIINDLLSNKLSISSKLMNEFIKSLQINIQSVLCSPVPFSQSNTPFYFILKTNFSIFLMNGLQLLNLEIDKEFRAIVSNFMQMYINLFDAIMFINLICHHFNEIKSPFIKEISVISIKDYLITKPTDGLIVNECYHFSLFILEQSCAILDISSILASISLMEYCIINQQLNSQSFNEKAKLSLQTKKTNLKVVIDGLKDVLRKSFEDLSQNNKDSLMNGFELSLFRLDSILNRLHC